MRGWVCSVFFFFSSSSFWVADWARVRGGGGGGEDGKMGAHRRWRWVQRRRLRMGADDGWKMIFRGGGWGLMGYGGKVCWWELGFFVFLFCFVFVQGSSMREGVG